MTTTNTAIVATIAGATFVNALKAALFAVSTDETRAHLNSLCITFPAPNVMRLQSTDGHWLWSHDVECECSQSATEHLVARHDVQAVVKAFDKTLHKELPYLLTISENRIALSRGNNQASYALVDGQFPPIENVIPKAFGGVAKIGFAPDYLADIGKAFTAIADRKTKANLIFEFTGDLGPAKITSNGLNALVVLMPVRI